MKDGLAGSRPQLVDSRYAWLRLGVALLLTTVGSVGMWSYVVVLPAVQADFGIARADATFPYTMCMVGFAAGNALLGRLADRYGIIAAVLLGIACLGMGYVGAGLAPNMTILSLAHVLIGLGAAASFAPMIADISHWFLRRRGIAVAIAASGNYFAGAIWPPVIQHFTSAAGWRPTHIGIGLFCVVAMLPLSLMFRQRTVMLETPLEGAGFRAPNLGISQNALFVLLCIAGVACCVAMAMPQVHIVAYCGDLGYGVARGAEMLSIMLIGGIFSRIASGFIADKVGGVMTMLIGSFMQAVALALYFFFDGLTSLYLISLLFGLFQGGIVPSYAIIIREYFPPKEAGSRVGTVIMATVFGMALGGWMSGWIFDLTGSYRIAFLNGLAWNLLNLAIAIWLLRAGGRPKPAMA
ncbi:MFS transporter [Pseudorhodoplanes sinuspersici]|uniref:MFS transporter n=1 Tax=Pseudorhodoplanes sinuspersici TaxID=1235591 RepID=A0A1W6ZR86_9HYPH|nr:MFS transporter [Pseudorhodoplanes sinuspersici]ARP99889.1 MFS transporter [Pseudorhodoplanes sinuspersici]RKE70907.1 sugar phosphate permease [Pseudorhodoplanes sinuspersici]